MVGGCERDFTFQMESATARERSGGQVPPRSEGATTSPPLGRFLKMNPAVVERRKVPEASSVCAAFSTGPRAPETSVPYSPSKIKGGLHFYLEHAE